MEIRLLGGFSLSQNGRLVSGLSSPKIQSLLAFLLLHRGMPQPRQQLAFILWPDSTEAQARTNLRKLLHQLVHALPEANLYLQSDGQELQWVVTAPLLLDVQEFEDALQAAGQAKADQQDHLARAIQLYQGDLFPASYDEWVEAYRERLRRAFTSALERLIVLLEEKRDYLSAIAFTERWLQLDPLNEGAHRQIMRLHALRGDRAEALNAYQACAALLKKELSVEPDLETRALYQRLVDVEMDGRIFPVQGSAQQIRPLVGREREWTLIQQVLSRMEAGRPDCLIVSGEAGIGKTRLAEEILLWAARQGYRVATANCFASEGGLAYASAADWLRTPTFHKQWITLDPIWLSELARVMPEIYTERSGLPQPERLTADWQRRRLFEAMMRALGSPKLPVAALPIVLLLNDIQWCDRETLAWLHYLMRSVIPQKLLLVGTLRSEELTAGHPLEAWLNDLGLIGRLTEVELDRLTPAQTKLLAENEAGRGLDKDAAAQLFAETEGHPLFVVESVRMAGDADPLVIDWTHTQESVRRLSASPTIQAVISRRLTLLSPAARDLAGLAATVGHSFRYSVLVQASRESSEETLVRGLDELLQRRIIREQGPGSYDFSHDKIRVAVYQRLSTTRRRFLHRCVAESLEDLSKTVQADDMAKGVEALSGQIGSQFEKAGLPERALPYYLQAAEVCLRLFANERALNFFRSALGLLPDAAGQGNASMQWARIEEQTGDLLMIMTHRAEARGAFEHVLRILPVSNRVQRAGLLRKIGNTWRDEYHFEESLNIYRRALQELGQPVALEPTRELEWWQSWIQIQIEIQNVYYWLEQIENSAALTQTMLPMVERYATFSQRADFYKIIAMIGLRANHYIATKDVVTFVESSLEASLQAGIPERIPADRFTHGFTLLFYGDLDRAEEAIQDALHLAERRGDLSLETRCLTYMTIARRKRADVGAVLNLARRALSAAENAKMPEYMGAARANLAYAALKQKDPASARAHGLAALELWGQSAEVQAVATPYFWTAIWPLVGICLDGDDLPDAFGYARKLVEPHRKGLPAELTASLRRAVTYWDSHQPLPARDALASTLVLAESLGEF